MEVMIERKIVIVLGLIILILIIGFVVLKQTSKEYIQYPIGQVKEEESEISLEEKQLIEAWIIKKDFNQYGDPKDTVYLGGAPLFDETTGQSADKYEYILQGHSDRPWKKVIKVEQEI